MRRRHACGFRAAAEGQRALKRASVVVARARPRAAALGSIATDEVLPVLRSYREDAEPVVRESCEVALDMYAWETSDTFQYADGLAQIAAATGP